MSSQGRYAAAVSAATAKVLAWSTVTASNGTPTTAIALPAPLIVSPIHSSRKFRCHSRPPGRGPAFAVTRPGPRAGAGLSRLVRFALCHPAGPARQAGLADLVDCPGGLVGERLFGGPGASVHQMGLID